MKITFYRSTTNDKQQLYKSPILSVTIPDTLPKDQAVAAAVREFQECMNVAHWQTLAEFYEIEH